MTTPTATARLGLGTYRIQPGAVPAAVARAAGDSATAWIDTAPNYLHGSAQKLIAPALPGRALALSTKVGFLSPAAARDAVNQGILPLDAVRAGYSLDPGYIQWQCNRSRAELGVTRLDAVFAHNPEHLRDDTEDFLRVTIAALEKEAESALCGFYGVATWAGFDTGKLTVPGLDRQAASIAGAGHHLRAIQLPVSLVSAGAFSQALDGTGPVADAAARGWDVFASAPLHGGELPRLATRELADLLDPGLTVAQACLLAVASCAGVTRVLLSASSPRHWNDAREALLARRCRSRRSGRCSMYSPPDDPGGAQRMRVALARAAAALGADPDGPGTWGWRGRTLSSPASHPDCGPCWLRLAAAPEDRAHGKTWDGNRDAQIAFGAAVRRPALHAVHDDVAGGWAYRAELSELLRDPVLAPEPVLRTEPGLPGTWWKSLRASIDAVAAVSTSRVAVRQEWADRAVPQFLGIPAPRITRWATAHGDLHPANLTAGAEPWLLDWEGYGIAPVGYDAAMLHAYALMTTEFSRRVREAFPVLAAPEGRTAQVIVAAELLQSASRGDHPDLVPALWELI